MADERAGKPEDPSVEDRDEDRESEALDEREEPEESDRDESEEDDQSAQASSGAAAQAGGAVARAQREGPGFFAFYKPGQGYYTRLCTAIAIALVVFTIAAFFYERMQAWFVGADGRAQTGIIIAILGGVVSLIGLWVFRLLNKPGIVDFLIATESEMKKVNWTTRKELWGSTKVVIFFMFLIAVILFVIDVIFGYFFVLIRVLEFGPFGV
jgi:preprotein translocase SecE subunit